MKPAHYRAMVSIVKAIHAGQWTAETPSWAPRGLTECSLFDDDSPVDALRAVQTAEAFIALALSMDSTFQVHQFLKDCGFTR